MSPINTILQGILGWMPKVGAFTDVITNTKNNCFCVKIKNIVFFTISLDGAVGATSGTPIATFPEGFRPSSALFFYGTGYAGSAVLAPCQYELSAGGKITQTHTPGAATRLSVSGIFQV